MWTCRRPALAALACLSLAACGQQQGQTFDLVIHNGRVMDPQTQHDSIANVGIKDGKISVITREDIKGDKTIHAPGLLVAPAFIDTHLHAQDLFGSKMALRDGTTIGLELESGGTTSRNESRLIDDRVNRRQL